MRYKSSVICLVLLALVGLAPADQRGTVPAPLTRLAANAVGKRDLLLDLAGLPAGTAFRGFTSRRLMATPAPIPKSSSAQIFLDGVIEAATLDTPGHNGCTDTDWAEYRCGGSITVLGVTVTVPKNLITFFPANAMLWQEIFINDGGWKTKLAQADGLPAGVSYAASIAANRVNGQNQVIAGMIDISQTALVGGSGYVDSIDYINGELIIETNGGPGTRVRLNDPTGKYGKQQPGLDPRFTVDFDNPTVRSDTGYPMCIPVTDPAVTDDPHCPARNRPVAAGTNVPLISFDMEAVGGNPRLMAPFVVGEYVSFAGVQAKDSTGSFVAAYEVVSNSAIYTTGDLAYASFEAALIGTGGLIVLGAGEATIRTRFEGSSTDSQKTVQLWGLDFNPDTGVPAQRNWGQVLPDPGPAGGLGAVRGRWRFRPPCTNSAPGIGNKGCTPPAAGSYLPPTREVMAEILGCVDNPDFNPDARQTDPNYRRIKGCTYRNPTIEYIWPENVPGSPQVELNFGAIPFLAQGGYASPKSSVIPAQLAPWPSDTLPPQTCIQPAFLMGGSSGVYTATAGGSVTITAAVTGPGGPYSLRGWTSSVAGGTLTVPGGASSATPDQFTVVYSPVTVDGTVITLKVTDACGKEWTASATINLQTTATPVIQAIPAQTVANGAPVKITAVLSCGASCSSTAMAAFAWAPTSGTTISGTPTQTPSSGATAQSVYSFSAPVLAVGTLNPTVMNVNVQATNAGGPSATVKAVVTVSPPQDTITFAGAAAVDFRCDKHRMSITVGDNFPVTAPQQPTLTLNDYTDNLGRLVNVAAVVGKPAVFTYTGAQTFVFQFEGLPLPKYGSLLTVTSQLGAKATFMFTTAQVSKTGCTV